MIQPTHSTGLPEPGSLHMQWKELFLMTKLDTIVNALNTHTPLSGIKRRGANKI